MRQVNSKVENLKALIDNKLLITIRRSIEDLMRINFITDNMSLIASLKEEVAYLRKENIIEIEIIKSLTEKIQVFLHNENPNRDSKISSTDNEKISRPKFQQKMSIIEPIRGF